MEEIVYVPVYVVTPMTIVEDCAHAIAIEEAVVDHRVACIV
jgi:hypothetical protein